MLKRLSKSLLLLLTAVPLLGAAPIGQSGAPPDGIRIDQERIEGILGDFVAGKRDVLPQARLRLRNVQAVRPFVLPAGELHTEVIPSDPQILGSRRFTILFRIEGRLVQNLPVRAELEAIAPVVVAAGDLARGAVLSRRDLNLAEIDLAAVRHPCFDPEELVGRKLKQAVRLGAPVDRTAIEVPPVVRRGEAVTINLRQGTLLLTAGGEAQQDGREGETIRVRNSASRKEILCRVVASGQVQVEL